MALTDQELRGIAGALSRNNQFIIASGIAKMYLASPDPKKTRRAEPGSFLRRYPDLSNTAWTDTGISGALVLVYDKSNYGLGFQLWSLVRRKAVFSYEIYHNLSYEKLSKDIHCFEIDDCFLGFAFSDGKAADKFYSRAVDALTKFREANMPRKISAAQQGSAFNLGLLTPSALKRNTPGLLDSSFTSSASKSKSQTPNFNEFLTDGPSKKAPKSRLGRRRKKKKRGTTNQSSAGSENRKNDSSFRNDVSKNAPSQPLILPTGPKPIRMGNGLGGTSANGRNQRIVGQHHPYRGGATSVVLKHQQRRPAALSVNVDGSLDPSSLSVDLKKVFKQAGIKKKDLRDPAFSMAVLRDIQRQEMLWAYQEKPEYKNVAEKKLERAVEGKIDDYNTYLNQLADYEYFQEHKNKMDSKKAKLNRWQKEQGGTVKRKPRVPQRQRVPEKSRLASHNNVSRNGGRDTSFEASKGRSSKPRMETGMPPPTPRRRRSKQHRAPTSPLMKSPSRSRPSIDNTFSSAGIQSSRHTEQSFSNSRPPPTPLRKAVMRRDIVVEPLDMFGDDDMPPPPPPPDDDESDLTPVDAPELPQLDLALIPDAPPLMSPAQSRPDFLGDIATKRYNLAAVNNTLQVTMNRLKGNLANEGKGNDLMNKLRVRIQQRRKDVRNDDESGDEDSDWSFD